MKNVVICIIFFLNVLSFSQTKNDRIKSNNLPWYEEIQRQSKRYQEIVSENYKDIYKPTNYAGDTPREYDQRLPHIADNLLPTAQKFKEFSRIIPWAYHIFFGPFYKFYVRFFYGLSGEDPSVLKVSKKYKKIQDEIPKYIPFPCQTEGFRSKERPTSVHKLRPGDIDVVVAVGDSIVSGMSLAGSHVYSVVVENRGLSAFGGGQGTWRKYMTLPNILKEFNPNLYGFATGDSIYPYNPPNAKFNVAVAAGLTGDVQVMLETAIQRMKKDPKVNFKQDWKLYNIFIGTMDLCHDICNWKRPLDAVNHVKYTLNKAFTYLMENSPRTIVNYLLVNPISYIESMKGYSTICDLLKLEYCTCLFPETFKHNKEKHGYVAKLFVDAQSKVLENPKFKSKQDFAILVQPIFRNLTLPKVKTKYGESSDFRLLGADCFHLSQRGHAYMARSIWNSMFTPYGQKIADLRPNLFSHFKCPSEDRPYIITTENDDRNVFDN